MTEEERLQQRTLMSRRAGTQTKTQPTAQAQPAATGAAWYTPSPSTAQRIGEERQAAVQAREGSAQVLQNQLVSRQANTVNRLMSPPSGTTRAGVAAPAQTRTAPQVSPQQVQATPLGATSTALSSPVPPPGQVPATPTFAATTVRPGVTQITSNVRSFNPLYTNMIEGGASPEQARGFAAQALFPQEQFVTDNGGNRVYPFRRGMESPEFKRLYSRYGGAEVGATQEQEAPVSRVLEENPGLGGGTFQTKLNPATGKMERTQISDTALDFGRADRERLNRLYAEKIDAGVDPVTAASDARLESMAMNSPGGLTQARALSGLRQRRAAQDLAADQQTLAEQQAEWVDEKNMAEAAILNQRARLYASGGFTPAGNAIASGKAAVTPENQKAVERVFGSISETPSETGEGVQYNVPGVGRSLNQAEMAALMEFVASDFAQTGVQQPASYYINALKL